MRTFYSGTGADTTAAVRSYFASNSELQFADLFVINTAPCYWPWAGNGTQQALGQQFLLTSFPAPLKWNYRGTFLPANIQYSAVESKIGLQADNVDLIWSPQPAQTILSPLTVVQGLFNGIFDNGLVEIWRCLMPTLGDCNTLGACLLFAGRIGELELDRVVAKIKVLSLLETFNEQVPTNLIEPGNILTQYSTGVLPLNGAPAFTVGAGSTAAKVLGTFSGTYDSNPDTYNTGYIVMGDGTQLGGTYRRIRLQMIESGAHSFYLSQPLPFAPTIGDTFAAYIPVASGYSLIPFNVPSPIIQRAVGYNGQTGGGWPDGTEWAFQLNGSTMTGIPQVDGQGGERLYAFMYHDWYNDVYTRIEGGAANSWNDNYPVVAPDGTVTFPGDNTNPNATPPHNEPGIGSTVGTAGFPFVPVPINSTVNI